MVKSKIALSSLALLTALTACSGGAVHGEVDAPANTSSGISSQALRPTTQDGILNQDLFEKGSKGPATETRREIQSLLQLFQRKNWTELETRAAKLVHQLEATLSSPENRSTLQAARNLQGMALLFLSRASESELLFAAAYQQEQDPTIKPYYGYNLASAQAESNKWTEARKTVEALPLDSLDRTTRIKLMALRARALAGTDAHAAAARTWLELQGQAAELLDGQMIRERLATSLSKIEDPILLTSLQDDFALSKLGDEVQWRLQQVLKSLNRDEESRTALEKLAKKYPNSKYISEAQLSLQGAAGNLQVASRKIGALFPLTGKLSRLGQKALQALQLSLGIYRSDDDTAGTKRSSPDPDSGWILQIEDAGEDEATAAEGLKRLAETHQVAAVVGPIPSRGIDTLTRKADEYGVPLISLAQQPGTEGGWLFNGGMTSLSQAWEIARYAIQDLKITRFAIIHPRDKFGEQYARLFWDAVEDLGGEVRGIESYAPAETDFRFAIEKLVGLSWPDARTREVNALARQRAQMNITKRTMKTEKYFALPPIVDFEAVFIADEPRVAAQVIPTFAYRDVEGVQFLGNATWNSPELIARAQTQVEGALFPDVFQPVTSTSESNLAATRFRTDYRATFHQEPSATDALAYDAGGILKAILRTLPENAPRSEIREKIRKLEEYSGAAGRISADENGRLKRKLQIIEIRGGKFILAR